MTDDLERRADYSEDALAERCIDFLEVRADAWMADTGVQRMFNAIASVFEPYAPQEIMDRFREKLGMIGRQCHVEGALRAWEEIAQQQRALGKPLPCRDEDPSNPTVPADEIARLREALEHIAALSDQREEPWPEGSEMDRLHFWRDRVIDAAEAARRALQEGSRHE